MQTVPNSWRAILVDECISDRRQLASLLATHHEIQIVAEASSVIEAAELCEKLKPDLLFLEIQMLHSYGFELLPMLSPLPALIFVTSQEKFAFHAIEVGAVDYLLKPVDADRLSLALSRLRGRLYNPEAESFRILPMADVMIVPIHRGYRVVPTSHLVYLKADGNYSTVFLSNGRDLYVYRSLQQWEVHLPKPLFLRLDRSLIIAPAHILDLEVISRESADMRLTGMETPMKIGRTAITRLKQFLGASDLAKLPKRIVV